MQLIYASIRINTQLLRNFITQIYAVFTHQYAAIRSHKAHLLRSVTQSYAYITQFLYAAIRSPYAILIRSNTQFNTQFQYAIPMRNSNMHQYASAYREPLRRNSPPIRNGQFADDNGGARGARSHQQSGGCVICVIFWHLRNLRNFCVICVIFA